MRHSVESGEKGSQGPVMKCIAPGSTTPDDLLAFVEQEAPPSVVSHVNHCPACAAEAHRYASLQDRLRRRLSRVVCPSPQTLGDYHLGLLEPDERYDIARHLGDCRRCAAELRTLREFLEDSPPIATAGRVERAIGSLRRVAASLVRPGLNPAYAGLRGGTAESQTFRAGDISISIGVGPTSRGGRITISGLITRDDQPADLFTDHGVRLLAADRIAETARVDDLGNFDLENVSPGSYTLEIDLDDALVAIDDLKVEDPRAGE